MENVSLERHEINDVDRVLAWWLGRSCKFGTRRLECYVMAWREDGSAECVGYDVLKELVRLGYATRRVGGAGTFGHVDFFLTDAGAATGLDLIREAA